MMIGGMKKRFEQVAVLMGGMSSERDVSIRSGTAVAAGLRDAGYRVSVVDVRDPEFELSPSAEAVFIALHGAYGEDGGVQTRLRAAGIPYTGADPESSRAAFDKSVSRERLRAAGVPIPEGRILDAPVSEPPLPLPLVVKPARQGSSVGCGFVFESGDWTPALAEAFRYDTRVVVEAYIEGSELTVGFIGTEPLPVVEIRAPDGRYDLRAKYTAGLTQYLAPAPLPDAARREAQEWSLRTYEALGCRGFGRVDLRRTPQGEWAVLELNTIPGFTPTSLLPKAAAAAGIPFPDLCDRILNLAEI